MLQSELQLSLPVESAYICSFARIEFGPDGGDLPMSSFSWLVLVWRVHKLALPAVYQDFGF